MRSAETRAKISIGRLAHIAQHDGSCLCLSGQFKKGQPSVTRPKGIKLTEKQRINYKGPKSDPHREALSRAAKRRYSNPAERERQSKQQQKRWQDPELLARHSEIIKEHWAHDPERRFNPGYVNPSFLGWNMIDFLIDAGFEIILPEVQFGRYRVDVLLADEWVAFEADEEHHEKTKQQDELRDGYLMKRYGLPVVRLSEEDLASWRKGE